MKFEIYFCDTETTGFNLLTHSPIEISLYRLSTNTQKTWFLKPIDYDNISIEALKVNGHKLEDLKLLTKFGKDRYQDPNKVLVEIENWLEEDMMPCESRLLVGHNIGFDKNMLEHLWIKCNAKDSFPFGRRTLDTMMIELFQDFCKDEFAEGYSLHNLCKKYSIKNAKAHSAESDTVATKDVFLKQVELFRKIK